MRNLVSHHAGQFGFLIGSQDQACVHVEKSARERDSVDFVGVNDFDGEGNLRVGILDQVLPDPVDVLRHDRILNQSHLRFQFFGNGTSQRDLRLETRGHGMEPTLIDIAVADILDIGVLLLGRVLGCLFGGLLFFLPLLLFGLSGLFFFLLRFFFRLLLGPGQSFLFVGSLGKRGCRKQERSRQQSNHEPGDAKSHRCSPEVSLGSNALASRSLTQVEPKRRDYSYNSEGREVASLLIRLFFGSDNLKFPEHVLIKGVTDIEPNPPQPLDAPFELVGKFPENNGSTGSFHFGNNGVGAAPRFSVVVGTDSAAAIGQRFGEQPEIVKRHVAEVPVMLAARAGGNRLAGLFEDIEDIFQALAGVVLDSVDVFDVDEIDQKVRNVLNRVRISQIELAHAPFCELTKHRVDGMIWRNRSSGVLNHFVTSF